MLACDDRVIAVRMTLSGTHVDGCGAFDVDFGAVMVIENGRRSREDVYEPEDRRAMLVQFAEVGGGLGPLGDRPPERWMAELCRRWAACDVEGLVDLYADDFVHVDHRALAWEEIHKDDMRPVHESFLATGSDWWCEVDEVLACDDRVIALSVTFHCTNNDGDGP